MLTISPHHRDDVERPVQEIETGYRDEQRERDGEEYDHSHPEPAEEEEQDTDCEQSTPQSRVFEVVDRLEYKIPLVEEDLKLHILQKC